ncbi:Low molecular weight protein-tyrosine-phosphatase [Azospirillaceae bacterium]
MFKVLFVCTGNICRSPTAEGVFRHRARLAELGDMVLADSAGIGDWHTGEPPDHRSILTARGRGYEIGDLRARQVTRRDFSQFDLLLGMDRDHVAALRRMAPPKSVERARLFLDFSDTFQGRDVPDPYYGGQDGFEDVVTLIESGVEGLLQHIRQET